MKTCSKCRKRKRLSSFPRAIDKRSGVSRRIYRADCKLCRRKQAKNWRKSNPQKKAADNRLRKYGITENEYQSLLIKHRNQCAICGSPLRLVIDHNHLTGAIRGILCNSCNTALGLFKDSIDNIEMALKYLKGNIS